MFSQFFTKERLITISCALFTLVLIISGVFFYFNYWLNRDLFPKVTSSVNEQDYTSRSYKKVLSSDEKYSYFLPDYFYESDSSLRLHSDILNGSTIYMNAIPNNLGVLTKDLCQTFAKQSFEKLKKEAIFTNAEFNFAEIKKYGDYEGCISSGKLARIGNNYLINQFFIFRKDRIYQIFIQVIDSDSGKEMSESVLKSVWVE